MREFIDVREVAVPAYNQTQGFRTPIFMPVVDADENRRRLIFDVSTAIKHEIRRQVPIPVLLNIFTLSDLTFRGTRFHRFLE